MRVPRSAGVRDVWLRTVRDGEPRLAPAHLDRSDEHEDWYVAEVLVHNPETGYRFFLDEGEHGYRWLNGRGVWDRDVPDAADFRLTVHEGAPAWMRDGVVYQVFPDRFARSAAADGRPLPEWAVPAAWDDEPHGAGPDVGTQYYGATSPGSRSGSTTSWRSASRPSTPPLSSRGAPTTATTRARSTTSTRCSAVTRRTRR